MESRHFLRVGDTVEDSGGNLGQVVEGSALYAVVEWAHGERREVDQFAPEIWVVLRAGSEGGS